MSYTWKGFLSELHLISKAKIINLCKTCCSFHCVYRGTFIATCSRTGQWVRVKGLKTAERFYIYSSSERYQITCVVFLRHLCCRGLRWARSFHWKAVWVPLVRPQAWVDCSTAEVTSHSTKWRIHRKRTTSPRISRIYVAMRWRFDSHMWYSRLLWARWSQSWWRMYSRSPAWFRHSLARCQLNLLKVLLKLLRAMKVTKWRTKLRLSRCSLNKLNQGRPSRLKSYLEEIAIKARNWKYSESKLTDKRR